MNISNLHFKYTISRGRNTDGYNICSLLVDGTKIGQTCGGGYDMKGVVFAEWLQKTYPLQLMKLAQENIPLDLPRYNSYTLPKGERSVFAVPGFYGLYLNKDSDGKQSVHLKGNCGFNSMIEIAKAIGIELKWNKESDRYKNHIFYNAIIN